MFNDWHYMLTQDRAVREQDLAERMAERQKFAPSPEKPSLRARVARRLFELAVATESEETWRVVWERLEARGRL
jgi:anti-sigma-K factor RskA